MKTKITTEKQHNEVAEAIEIYLKKGSQGMTCNDKQELRHLSVFAEAYELKNVSDAHATTVVVGYDSN